jgi:hypothetical protein
MCYGTILIKKWLKNKENVLSVTFNIVTMFMKWCLDAMKMPRK